MTMDFMRRIIAAVRYKDWQCMLNEDIDGKPYLQWGWHAACAVTGENKWWTSRKHMLSVHMLEGEVVQTAFYAALQAEEHECREQFRYGADRPFQPHVHFDALRWASRQTKGRTSDKLVSMPRTEHLV